MLAKEDSFWRVQVIGRGLGVGLFFPPIEESSPLPEETGSPERLLLGELVQTLTALLGCKEKKSRIYNEKLHLSPSLMLGDGDLFYDFLSPVILRRGAHAGTLDLRAPL